MSQPEAAEDTQPPTLETMVATQMIRKVRWRKAPQDDVRAGGAAAGVPGCEGDSLIGARSSHADGHLDGLQGASGDPDLGS